MANMTFGKIPRCPKLNIAVGVFLAAVGETFAGPVAEADLLAVNGSSELFAGQGEVVTNFVSAEETRMQNARLVTADGGRIEKTGGGHWVIPRNIRQTFHPLAVDVVQGTVSLPAATGAVPTNHVPAFIAETAAMWLDASVPSSLDKRIEGGSCFVDNWYDVRETTPASPAYFHAKANLGSTINNIWSYTALAPELKETNGLQMVWFGGHSSSRSMTWYTPSGILSHKRLESKVRHVFVLRGAWDCWGTIIGTIPSLTETSLHYTQPCPLLAPSQYGTSGRYGKYSTDAVDLYTRNARLYENGVRVNPQTTTPCKGMALLDFSTVNEPFAANTFFNDRNFIGSDCPFYGGDRGGGEYIAEAIVFTNVLAEAQRLQVEAYLMHKWLGEPAVQEVDLRLSPAATLEFASPDDIGSSIAGNGRVTPATDDDMVFSSKDKTLPRLNVVPGEGALTMTKTMPLAVAAGDRIDAVFTEDGPRVTRAASAADAFVKTGEGAVSIGALGGDVRTFDVQAGRVTIRPEGAAVVSPHAPVPVFIANPSFEEGWTDNQRESGQWWSWNNPFVSGWTVEKDFPSGDGFAYYAPSGKCGPGSAWNLQVTPAEGDWFVLIRSGLRLSTPVTIPADGTYEVSFAWSARPGYLGGQIDVRLVSEDLSTTNAFGRLIVTASDTFRTCRFRSEVTAGAYRLVFTSRTDEDCPVLLDDVALAQVFPLDDGTEPVPGGDFEGTLFANAAAMKTFVPGGTQDGWTLGEHAGPVTFLADTGDYRESRGYLYNDSRRGLRGSGSVQLVLTDATSVSRTFRPSKGVWNLVAALDYCNGNNSSLRATVSKGGDEIDLGSCRAASHLMEDVVWPNAFEADGTEEVTLTLTFDNSSKTTERMIVDDIRLVKAAASTAELVRNGDFDSWYSQANTDSRANWCQVKGPEGRGEAYILSYDTGKPHWGYAVYDGTYRLKLTGDAYTYQTLTFPSAGSYRLSFHMSHRYEPDYPSWGDFGHNPVKVWLTRGGAYTNQIALVTEFTTNYVQQVFDFVVPEAGEWDLAFGGTRIGDYSSLVDGVSVRAIDVPEAVLPFEAEAEVKVASGAKLDLSFVGTNQVRSIRLGGRAVSGVVSAETHPDFIGGFGALYVAPRATCLILR